MRQGKYKQTQNLNEEVTVFDTEAQEFRNGNKVIQAKKRMSLDRNNDEEKGFNYSGQQNTRTLAKSQSQNKLLFAPKFKD